MSVARNIGLRLLAARVVAISNAYPEWSLVTTTQIRWLMQGSWLAPLRWWFRWASAAKAKVFARVARHDATLPFSCGRAFSANQFCASGVCLNVYRKPSSSGALLRVKHSELLPKFFWIAFRSRE